MCLFPKLIKNPKYIPNKKNGFCAPAVTDERTMYVPIGCGVCIECMRKKAREWQVRLTEELKQTNFKGAHFITLTFNEQELNKLCTEKKSWESNYIATIAIRRFLERYRKEFKTSIKHWLVTELGGNHTERIHLHGIIWGDKEKIKKHWKYGIIDFGKYVNERSIGYITKYITKIDQKHKQFKPIILCSKGIGKTYIERTFSKKNKYKPNETNENYTLPNGNKIDLPIYYRNYLYTEEEREKLWIEKIEKKERYILGEKIDISTEYGLNKYYEILKNAQKLNKTLGYGDDSKEWNKKKYNVTLRKINKQKSKNQTIKSKDLLKKFLNSKSKLKLTKINKKKLVKFKINIVNLQYEK